MKREREGGGEGGCRSLIQALILEHAVCQQSCVCTICSEQQWQKKGRKYCLGIEAISQTAVADEQLTRGFVTKIFIVGFQGVIPDLPQFVRKYLLCPFNE